MAAISKTGIKHKATLKEQLNFTNEVDTTANVSCLKITEGNVTSVSTL
jgi:hypothetical protein